MIRSRAHRALHLRRSQARRPAQPARTAKGFTLIEMIVVIAILGVLAVASNTMIAPIVKAYSSQQLRTRMSYEIGSTMRTMTSELRSAVPNSMRSATSQCIEFVPTIAGGSYRRASDTTRAGSWPMDASGATRFDVLGELNANPAAGDFVVINNLTPSQIYSGSSRVAISSTQAQDAALGSVTINLQSSFTPASSYTAARFAVVSNAVKAVTYFCSNVTGILDVNGTASGQLMRRANYGFVATAPTSCPASSATQSEVVLDNVSDCSVIYTANEFATQQSGYVGLRLAVTRRGETLAMSSGAHVDNVP